MFRITGDITDDIGVELEKSGRSYLDSGETDRILIDLTDSRYFSADAKRRWVKFLQHSAIKKAAIFGGSMIMHMIASFIITATGQKNMQYFETEEEACAWLAD